MNEEIKLKKAIFKRRWKEFCFPKFIRVKRHPTFWVDGKKFYYLMVYAKYKRKAIYVSFYVKEDDKIDFEQFAKVFFSGCKRLKFKIKRSFKKK